MNIPQKSRRNDRKSGSVSLAYVTRRGEPTPPGIKGAFRYPGPNGIPSSSQTIQRDITLLIAPAAIKTAVAAPAPQSFPFEIENSEQRRR